MKVDERTVSITFFLNKRMKPSVHNNEDWYPIYARLHFSGNNTKLKVFDRRNRGVYATEKVFDDLLFFYQKKDFDTSHLEYGPGIVLLENEELIVKTVEYEWDKKKDDFNFKDYTKKLRIWQRDLQNVLSGFLLDEISRISQKKLDFNTYRRFEADSILGNDSDFIEWKSLIKNEEALVGLREIAEISIAYFQFIENLFYQREYRARDLFRKATYRGTVFSWIEGIDRNEFVSYIKKMPNSDLNKYGNAASKYFCKSFMEYFRVKSSSAEVYARGIQQYIEKIE